MHFHYEKVKFILKKKKAAYDVEIPKGLSTLVPSHKRHHLNTTGDAFKCLVVRSF